MAEASKNAGHCCPTQSADVGKKAERHGWKRKRFPHGNYTGYYGTRYGRPAYRHDSVVDNTDPRIDLLQASWFEGKKCLDVGCNEGHFTLALVRRFRPRQMVGIDIDCFLVQKARQALNVEIRGGVDREKREGEGPPPPQEWAAGRGAIDSTISTAGGKASSGATVSRQLMPRSVRGGQHLRLRGTAGPTKAFGGDPIKEAIPMKEAIQSASRDEKLVVLRSEPGKAGADEALSCSSGTQEHQTVTASAALSCGSIISRTSTRMSARKRAVVCPDQESAPRATETSLLTSVTDSPDGDLAAAKIVRRSTKSTEWTSRAVGSWKKSPDTSGLDGSPGRSQWFGDEEEPHIKREKPNATSYSDTTTAFLAECSVSFEREDFVLDPHGDHGYDVVALFSVVKWMHINGGDDAVRRVFRKAYTLLRPGGRLILEPQPWKSYKKSARQHGSPEAQANANTIRLRPTDFPAVLTNEVGFRSWEEIGASEGVIGGFASRVVHVFVK